MSRGNYEHTKEQMEKIAAKNRGRKHTQETKDRISQVVIGHKVTEQTRKRMSIAQRKRFRRAQPAEIAVTISLLLTGWSSLILAQVSLALQPLLLF